jgi:hypothetical protein
VFAKSIYDVAGLPTTASSAEWARLFPGAARRDALEVRRLRAAGAVVLGKTAADDFAYRGNGTSSHTGQVLNPHDPTRTRTPGGSSAGSAVAVAAGLAFAALGTDDGGSNRIPAQFTGVVGVKPSFGLVPRTGVIPTWPYLDTHGPLARTVADAALLLAAVAGADPSDPLAAGRLGGAPALRDDALAGVRLGLVEAHVPRARMTAGALAAWDRALGDLRAAGAAVEPFAPSVTRANVRDAFAAAARERGDAAPDANAPAPTANALLQYFAGRAGEPGLGDARAAVRRGYAAYRAFYDVLPATFEACEPLLDRPIVDDAAGRSFARSRARWWRARRVHARGRRGGDGLPDHAVQRPARRRHVAGRAHALGYGNWLGLPEVSVPGAGWAPTGCRRSTSRSWGCRRATRGARAGPRVRAAVAPVRAAAAPVGGGLPGPRAVRAARVLEDDHRGRAGGAPARRAPGSPRPARRAARTSRARGPRRRRRPHRRRPVVSRRPRSAPANVRARRLHAPRFPRWTNDSGRGAV